MGADDGILAAKNRVIKAGALYNGAFVVNVDTSKWINTPLDQSYYHLSLIRQEITVIEMMPSTRTVRFTHSPASILLVRPGEVLATHHDEKTGGQVSLAALMFKPKLAGELFDDTNIERLRDVKDPIAASLLEAAMHLNELSDPLLVDHITLAIMHRIRGLREIPNVKGNRRIEKSLIYISENIDQKLTLAELASAAFMSPYHFVRVFKEVTGMTPMAYVTNKRIERAKELLATGNLPIGVVSSLCGFSNQSQFNNTFRRIMGMTPKEYRRKVIT